MADELCTVHLSIIIVSSPMGIEVEQRASRSRWRSGCSMNALLKYARLAARSLILCRFRSCHLTPSRSAERCSRSVASGGAWGGGGDARGLGGVGCGGSGSGAASERGGEGAGGGGNGGASTGSEATRCALCSFSSRFLCL